MTQQFLPSSGLVSPCSVRRYCHVLRSIFLLWKLEKKAEKEMNRVHECILTREDVDAVVGSLHILHLLPSCWRSLHSMPISTFTIRATLSSRTGVLIEKWFSKMIILKDYSILLFTLYILKVCFICFNIWAFGGYWKSLFHKESFSHWKCHMYSCYSSFDLNIFYMSVPPSMTCDTLDKQPTIIVLKEVSRRWMNYPTNHF